MDNPQQQNQYCRGGVVFRSTTFIPLQFTMCSCPTMTNLHIAEYLTFFTSDTYFTTFIVVETFAASTFDLWSVIIATT